MAETIKELEKQITSLEKECDRLSEVNQKLNERVLELYTLYNVSKNLSLSLQLDELFDISMRIIGETMNVTDFNLMLVDETADNLYMQAVHGRTDAKVRKAVLSMGEGLPGKAIKSGKTLIVKDLSRYKGKIYAKGERPQKGSYLGIPLKRLDGEVIGIINAHKSKSKGFTDEDVHLFEAVAEHVGIAIDNARQYQRTKDLSHHDDLTGLFNRRYFYDRFEKEVERAKRYNRLFSVILLDLDHFKLYNDSFGHLAGDRALERVAEALNKTVRKVDIVARYGGEEFVIILPETDKENAVFVAEKLRKKVEKLKLGKDSTNGALTITLGVSNFPLDAVETLDLLESADKALYHGKALGRNVVCSRILDVEDS